MSTKGREGKGLGGAWSRINSSTGPGPAGRSSRSSSRGSRSPPRAYVYVLVKLGYDLRREICPRPAARELFWWTTLMGADAACACARGSGAGRRQGTQPSSFPPTSDAQTCSSLDLSVPSLARPFEVTPTQPNRLCYMPPCSSDPHLGVVFRGGRAFQIGGTQRRQGEARRLPT